MYSPNCAPKVSSLHIEGCGQDNCGSLFNANLRFVTASSVVLGDPFC